MSASWQVMVLKAATTAVASSAAPWLLSALNASTSRCR
jgi:hypothetical protein